MKWRWWPWRDARPDAAAADRPAPAADHHQEVRPDPAWSQLPALQRSVPLDLHPVAPLDRFTAGLSAYQNPSMLGDLGHLVDRRAPSGSVSGLAVPRSTPTPPAQRAIAYSEDLAGTASSSEGGTPLQRQHDDTQPPVLDQPPSGEPESEEQVVREPAVRERAVQEPAVQQRAVEAAVPKHPVQQQPAVRPPLADQPKPAVQRSISTTDPPPTPQSTPPVAPLAPPVHGHDGPQAPPTTRAPAVPAAPGPDRPAEPPAATAAATDDAAAPLSGFASAIMAITTDGPDSPDAAGHASGSGGPDHPSATRPVSAASPAVPLEPSPPWGTPTTHAGVQPPDPSPASDAVPVPLQPIPVQRTTAAGGGVPIADRQTPNDHEPDDHERNDHEPGDHEPDAHDQIAADRLSYDHSGQQQTPVVTRLSSQRPPLLPESAPLLDGSAAVERPSPQVQRISYQPANAPIGSRYDHRRSGRAEAGAHQTRPAGDALTGSGPLTNSPSVVQPVQRWTPQTPPAASPVISAVEPAAMPVAPENDVIPETGDADDADYTPLTSTSFPIPMSGDFGSPLGGGSGAGGQLTEPRGAGLPPATVQRSFTPPSAVPPRQPGSDAKPANASDPIRAVRPRSADRTAPEPVHPGTGPMSFDTMFGSYATSGPQPDLPVQRAADKPRPHDAGLPAPSDPAGPAGEATAVQRAADDSPPATVTPGTAAAPSQSGATDNVDELARRLFPPLSARLKAELWLDRERAGLITDTRP